MKKLGMDHLSQQNGIMLYMFCVSACTAHLLLWDELGVCALLCASAFSKIIFGATVDQ